MPIGQSRSLMLAGGVLCGWVMLRSAYVLAVMATAGNPGDATHGPFLLPGFGVPLGQIPLPPPRETAMVVVTGARGNAAPRVQHHHAIAHAPSLLLRHHVSPTGAGQASGGDAASATSEYLQNQLAMLAFASSPLGSGRTSLGLTNAGAMGATPARGASMLTRPEAPLPPIRRSEWAFSSWAFVRPHGEDAARLGRSPSLGASQFGAIAEYRLDAPGRVRGFVRLNSAGRAAGSLEGAAGVSLAPTRNSPVRLVVERRQAVAGGEGQSAFAAYAAGGFNALPVAGQWRVDGYGAAGVVGARNQRLFAEGSQSLHRPLARIGSVAVDGGVGVWAAAQKDASRVDVGPSIGAQPQAIRNAPRLSIDWRQRVAGNADPGSGIAITLAHQF